jgi:hypothetical protein
MQLNAIHMRFGAIAGGIVLFFGYLMCGGSFGGDRIVQLDFSMYPELFEGLEVEIDGQVVGKLESVGQATRSGFKVGKGEHRVRVLHPEYASEPLTVVLEKPGEKARLLLDLAEVYDSDRRRSKTAIVLQL